MTSVLLMRLPALVLTLLLLGPADDLMAALLPAQAGDVPAAAAAGAGPLRPLLRRRRGERLARRVVGEPAGHGPVGRGPGPVLRPPGLRPGRRSGGRRSPGRLRGRGRPDRAGPGGPRPR